MNTFILSSKVIIIIIVLIQSANAVLNPNFDDGGKIFLNLKYFIFLKIIFKKKIKE